MREALRFGPHRVEAHELENGRFQCPITIPPQLAVLEAAPRAPVAPLLAQMERHPAIRHVPCLLVLDREWLSMAPRLPCADFIAREFAATEAIARVDRLLGKLSPRPAPELQFGDLVVDLDGHEARLSGEPMLLTPQEFALLRHLVLHPGRALNREQLLDHVWGRDYFGGIRTVDIHVRRLRQKLGDEVEARLQTVRGVGYKWKA